MGLLQLPPEIISRVTSYLTTPELCAVRLTCKSLESTLFPGFAREYFSKRQFMFEHISLQAFVDIANHPTLSPYLTDVIFSLRTLLADEAYSHLDPYPLRFKRIAGHLDRDFLLSTGLARDMLVEAFSK